MAFYHQRISIPLFLFVFAFLLLSALARPAHAANSSSNIAFARKSFQGRRHHRHAGRRDIVDTAAAVVDSVTNGVDALVDGGGPSNSSSSSSSSSTTSSSTTTTTSSSTTKSSDSSTSTSSSTSTTTSDTSSTTSTTSSDSKTTPSNTASDSSTPSPTSSGSSSDSSTSATTTASATDPPPTTPPPSDSSSSTGSSSGTTPSDSSSNTASDSSSQSSTSAPGTTSVGDPTSTNPTPTDSSSDSGSSSPTDSSSNPPPTDSSSNSVQPTTTAPPDTTSSTPPDTPTQSASDSSSSSSSCGLLDVILGTCSTSTSSSSDSGPTVSQPSPTDSGTTSDSQPAQTDSSTTSDSGPTISIPPISLPPTTTSSAPPDTTSAPITISDTGPPTTTSSAPPDTTSAPITISDPGPPTTTSAGQTDTQTTTSSIAFPTGNGTTSSVFGVPTESFTSLSTLSALPDTSATSTFSMPPLQSQFSFLTASTLIVAPTTTSGSDSLTITNPDQATSTASLVGVSQTLAATQAALPSGLPARFLPAVGVTANDDLSGYSPVSIMFDSGLNWAFVAANPDTVAGEIFAYLCVVLQAALSIGQDSCKNYALQVYEPSTYQGPQDVSQLRTTWIGFIPSDLVDTLAAQIIAKQSPVYTGTTGIPNELAQHIDPSYGVKAVTDPFSSSDGGHNSNTTSSASSSADNVRRDAIIGVCAALGGIAVCILIWLVARNIKRRRESQHRRLSDPDIGTRVPGTQFDQDSVGGQRRRSFYYAEDSLRGYAAQQGGDEMYDHRISPQGGMRERRPVAAAAISAPILRDNTLNW